MTDARPEPLVPAEVDLRDFPFTPMYRARLFGSAFHAKASDSEWRAGLTLWLKSQDQSPAGSLPNDDIELCRLAELGRDLRTWRKLRANALHGWFECSDGRLYNKVTAQVANEQWQSKVDQRSRTIKARIAALEKRLSQAADETVRDDIAAQLHSLRQSIPRSVTTPVTEPVTASKGQGREEKGQLRDTSSHLPSPSPTENKNIKSVSHAGNGSGNGAHNVTIEDPLQRIARFQQKLAKHLGARGLDVVLNAMDSKHPHHAQSLALCKVAARELGKGWPRNWPIDP